MVPRTAPRPSVCPSTDAGGAGGDGDEDKGGARLGERGRLLRVPAADDGARAHHQLYRAEDERILHGVERRKRRAAVDVEVEVCLEVSAEGDLSNEGVDQDGELPPLVTKREDWTTGG